MVNPASLTFENVHSVRFVLDNFALPVVETRKKNTIYTQYLSGVKGTKRKLLSLGTAPETYGYDWVVRWGTNLFAANSHGLYYADQYVLEFHELELLVAPQKICAVNDRLFLIAANRQRLYYSVDLNEQWTPHNFLSGSLYIPDVYGLCLDIRYFQGKLLVVCENGLLTVSRSLVLAHYSDDSELLKANLATRTTPIWQSDWFSLGYATDTQTLREVLLETNAPLVLVVISNRTQRAIHVPAGSGVQKIKTNLNGDQFQLALLPGNQNFVVSGLSAVISYGTQNKKLHQ